MGERGNDIDFDFFDEPETTEATPRVRTVRSGGRRPPVRPPAGLTPLLRLVGLVALGILVVVLLVFWAQSCRSDSKQGAYSAYMDDVSEIARASDDVGRNFNTQLTTTGLRPQQLQERLSGLAQRQEQGVARARELTPPGPLRAQHQHAVDALQFRVSGLRRLQDAFRQTARREPGPAATVLSQQVQRLLTSDVIWSDLFREPAVAELRRQSIGGVEVPGSIFLRNRDLASRRQLEPIVRRLRGASTGGTPTGRHGNGLVSVRALPEAKVLDREADRNIVTATPELAFEVTIENSGESQEVQVVVLLTLQQPSAPISRRQTIDLIDAGEQRTVTFRNLGQVSDFGVRIPMRVEVRKVRGEQNTANNSAEFPVVFTLPD